MKQDRESRGSCSRECGLDARRLTNNGRLEALNTLNLIETVNDI